MGFTVEISDNVNEDTWNDMLIQNRASSIYQTPVWSTIYRQSFDSKPIFIHVKNDNGTIIGQLSAMIHKKYYWKDANIISATIGSKLNLQSILSWVYGPIIHDDLHHDQIVSKILSAVNEIATKNNVTVISGSSSPLSNSISDRIFENYDYKTLLWGTYIIDLQQKTDDLYNELDKKTRYDIRKSEKNELQFEVVNDSSSWYVYMELVLEARKREGQKRKRHQILFEKLWEHLYNRDNMKVFLVRCKGELLGGIETAVFNGNVIQVGVANAPKTELQGGSFLTWNAIKWSKERQYLTFDMGGINPFPDYEKERRIDFYKSKWGGKKFDYIKYHKILNKTKTKFSAILKDPSTVYRKINTMIHKTKF